MLENWREFNHALVASARLQDKLPASDIRLIELQSRQEQKEYNSDRDTMYRPPEPQQVEIQVSSS